MRGVLCTDGETICPEPEHTGCTDRVKLCADGRSFRDPFKIISYEFGAAHVFDRKTGEKCGYVLANFYSRWTPYRDGVELQQPFRYRRDAARWVWQSWVASSDEVTS